MRYRCNSAFFDVAHNFAGCIPGCHEVLRRQGLLEARGAWIRTEALAGQARRSIACTRACRSGGRRFRARESGEVALMNSKLGRWTLAVLAHLALLLAWYLFVRLGNVPKFVMLRPRDADALLQPNYSGGPTSRSPAPRSSAATCSRSWSAWRWRWPSPGRRCWKRSSCRCSCRLNISRSLSGH